MPAPSNANSLSLGRPVVDASTIDTMDDVRQNFAKLSEFLVGIGFACGAQNGDDVYQAVYAQPDGVGGHILYGGKPTDPLNPDVLVVSAAGSATVIWQDEGSTVATYGTVSFEGAGVTVIDGGTKAIVTIPGGGGGGSTNAFGTIQVSGQSDVVADAAPDTLELVASTGIVITTDAALDKITIASSALAFKTIQVSGQSDVAADAIDDTLTLVAGANVTITTNAGSDSITIAATDTNTTYTAGAGVNLSGTKFIADPNTASHVGLVDPATGDDSSADDAQIGVLWHAIEGFDDGRNQLHGHVADDASKPKVTCKTTEDWIELLEDYDSTKRMVVHNNPDGTGAEGDERVHWVESPQKVIWGIDPDGGHTITTAGTTLTLTLKVTKYTFDAVNFVSAVDEDVEIEYTGTECA